MLVPRLGGDARRQLAAPGTTRDLVRFPGVACGNTANASQLKPPSRPAPVRPAPPRSSKPERIVAAAPLIRPNAASS